ncbi:MAG TPA: 3-hydroxyacyl-ACP dehydratase FabZ family protein [Bacteriovoracaceae bacterium]|nr:3-hydroxyacyl-ACP dehydratase FabZ family protein [Bacteriovoracaceae bacterium]
MLLNKTQVMGFLPHRDPFLFIDEVKEIILPEAIKGKTGPFKHSDLIGGKVICTFKIDNTVKVLDGHFPGNPILPGVVQIEMMAQAASFMVIHCLEKPIEQCHLEVALLGVESAKFRRPIVPPMDLEIHAVLTKTRGSFLFYDGEIFCGGELMSQTTFMASLKIHYN